MTDYSDSSIDFCSRSAIDLGNLQCDNTEIHFSIKKHSLFKKGHRRAQIAHPIEFIARFMLTLINLMLSIKGNKIIMKINKAVVQEIVALE